MRRSLLRSNRNYRLLLSGSVVTNLGDGVVAVAMPWLAALLTRDPVQIAAVATAGSLPWFLFALPAGVWTDRADRRRLMIRADCVRLALAACVVAMTLAVPAGPVAAGAQAGLVATLAAIAFLAGTAEVVRDNAAQTLLPSIVAGDELERANGQMWSAEQVVGRFLGPPLAGALIAAGISVPFGFNAATLALAIGTVWLITLPARTPAAPARFWPALLEGVGWMRRTPPILRLAVMLGAFNAVAVGGWTILVLYAQEVLGLGARGYGLLLACAAAGGVLGGIVAPGVARRIGMRASLILALASFVLLHLALGLSRSVPLAALAMVLEAAGVMLWNVVTVSYRQRLIPDGLLGRVNAVYRFFAWGAMPFGALGAGALVSALEPAFGRAAALHGPYLLGALVCGGLLVYGTLRLRFDS
ncbi:Enterobactin exporter EntS [Methylobacterium crusticola]|uniref:Enterobactin exporter EntS n=1 Tax=Methylobacterium crusticola TaxID=1697972 RepID=A0ABQ4R2B2_9HYPH|nr:MFS transporter [Methylobacterium crusticola]GJD51796.1 Enterobactin exporter EntS [Methylobacterium crusticola]